MIKQDKINIIEYGIDHLNKIELNEEIRKYNDYMSPE